METRASYVLVGIFVMVFVFGVIIALIWLGGQTGQDRFAEYEVQFNDPVSGLGNGALVQYRGVPVGQVTSIRIDENDPTLIRVRIQVRETTPIKQDGLATLQYQGITGVAFVQLRGGSPESPRLTTPGPDGNPAVIQAQSSGLAELMERAPELFSSIKSLVDRAAQVLSDRNREAIAGILSDVDTWTDALADGKDDTRSILADGAAAMANFRRLTDQIEDDREAIRDRLRSITTNLDLFLQDVQPLAQDADIAVQEYTVLAKDLQITAEEVNGFLIRNREPLDAFADNGLLEITLFFSEARALASSVQRVVDDFGRDPARFLFGDQQKGFDAP